MRRIFLIRHAQPVFPNGVRHCCLGRHTDTPLTEEGRAQALAYKAAFDFIPAESFFTSPLLRSRETARLLLRGRGEARILPGIEELDCGEWEGLGFDEIKVRWPELYEARHGDMSIPPPGGETFDSAADRGLAAIRSALSETEGDIAIVAHAGLNRAVMCRILGIPMKDNRTIDQLYACVNVIAEEDGRFSVLAVGRQSGDYPADGEIEALYEKYETPEKVRAHCRAVCGKALELQRRMEPETDPGLLRAAALLHDVCRTMPHHAHAAARELRDGGYMCLADAVECHHDLKNATGFDAKKLLYLADKLVSGTQSVTLRERFALSEAKCTDERAKCAHERRRREAEGVYNEYLHLSHLAGQTGGRQKL